MYEAAESRYEAMRYRRCGYSGVQLSVVTLGLWHNFGDVDDYNTYRDVILHAFDAGVNHFDLANNYGPPPGSAERNFGKILKNDLMPYRDELIITSKAGFLMWDGPFGEWGSRKYLISSLDQSLKRMGLEYVDVFYSHRPDPDTPMEESMGALDSIVRQGKALYAGISNYDPDQTRKALAILKELGTPCLVHQPKYSMFHREPEEGLFDVLADEGVGSVVFSPLAQGLLTPKYLQGIPADSRAAKSTGFLQEGEVTAEVIEKVKALNDVASERGESLAQMALNWCLRKEQVTSVIVGARNLKQLTDNLGVVRSEDFTKEHLQKIEQILNDE